MRCAGRDRKTCVKDDMDELSLHPECFQGFLERLRIGAKSNLS